MACWSSAWWTPSFTVLPVNPDLITRRRGPARKKDDTQGACLACLLALDRHTALRPLIAHDERGGELAARRPRRRAGARDQRRLLNRLRQDLPATYPTALAIAGDDLGAPTMLRLLECWPTLAALVGASRGELVSFARQGHSSFEHVTLHPQPSVLAFQVA